MTTEILLWSMSVVMVPVLLSHVVNTLTLKRLLKMHENPEGTGFGTVGFQGVIAANTEAIRDLTHYLRWMARQQGLPEAPPPIGDAGSSGAG